MQTKERLVHVLILSAFLRWLGPNRIPQTEAGRAELIERFLSWRSQRD